MVAALGTSTSRIFPVGCAFLNKVTPAREEWIWPPPGRWPYWRIFGKTCSCGTDPERSRDSDCDTEIVTGLGLSHVAPVKDDLAGVAGAHRVEALFVVSPVHPVG